MNGGEAKQASKRETEQENKESGRARDKHGKEGRNPIRMNERRG